MKRLFLRLFLSSRDFRAWELKRTRKYDVNEDWLSNKWYYNSYFNMEGAIGSLDEVRIKAERGSVYLTMFRSASYYKGDRYGEYLEVWNDEFGGVELPFKVSKSDVSIFLTTPTGESTIILQEKELQSYRYSTSEEIQEFEEVQSKLEPVLKAKNSLKVQLYSLEREAYLLTKKWSSF